jgi:hypothetical protein
MARLLCVLIRLRDGFRGPDAILSPHQEASCGKALANALSHAVVLGSLPSRR